MSDRYTAEQLAEWRKELLATLQGLCELRDEWRAHVDQVDRRRAERERGG